MKSFIETAKDFWYEVPKSAKQIAYGFLAGFVLGLIL
jgi:hypothetical protein